MLKRGLKAISFRITPNPQARPAGCLGVRETQRLPGREAQATEIGLPVYTHNGPKGGQPTTQDKPPRGTLDSGSRMLLCKYRPQVLRTRSRAARRMASGFLRCNRYRKSRRDQSDSAVPGSRPYTRRVGRDTPGTSSRGTAARPYTDVDLPHGTARSRAARLYGLGGEPPRASAAHSHCSPRAAVTSNTDTI